jgi:hypothetical protein
MFMTYGEAVNAEDMCYGRYLPEGLVEGCRLLPDVARDEVLTYDGVDLPADGSPTGSGRAVSSLPGASRGSRSGACSGLTPRDHPGDGLAGRPIVTVGGAPGLSPGPGSFAAPVTPASGTAGAPGFP